MATYDHHPPLTPYGVEEANKAAAVALDDRLKSAAQTLNQCVSLLEAFENRPTDHPPAQQGIGPTGLMMTGELIGNRAEHLLALVQRITERLGRM